MLAIEIARYRDPPPFKDQPAVNALRGGATVLLVASIEAYLKSALEEYIDEIAKEAKTTTHAKLPKGFGVHNDFRYLQATIQGRETKIQKILEVRRVAVLIAASKFVPESFSRTQANPGAETVSNLLREFGIQDPLRTVENHLARHLKRTFTADFARSQLDGLLIARNQVAHGLYSLSKSRQDIRDWIAFSFAFCKAADNTIRERTYSIISDLK